MNRSMNNSNPTVLEHVVKIIRPQPKPTPTPALQVEDKSIKRTISEVDSDSEDELAFIAAAFNPKKQRVGEDNGENAVIVDSEAEEEEGGYSSDGKDELASNHSNETDDLYAERGEDLEEGKISGLESSKSGVKDDEEVTFKHGKVTFSMLKSEIYSEEPYSPEELEAMKKESYYCIQTKIAEQLDFLRAHPNTPVSRYLVKKCEILQGIQTQKYRLASGESVSEVVKELSQPWSDPEKKQQYRTLCNKLKNGLAAVKDKTISTSTIQELLVHVNILESKYRAELEPKRSKKAVRGPWPKTAEEAKELMRGPAEIERPWCEPPTPAPSILFRTWDAKSQCRILNADEGLYSGGANSNFDTRKGRTRDLESHGNWGTRKPTVFISVTCSIRDIAMTWTRAFGNRQDLPFSTIRITVLNPNARIEAGWPILCMVDELDYYKFKTPIKCSRATYVNEYLLPYRAPREEVVWTFHWTDVERWMREHHTQDADMWRDRLAQPLLDVHERLRKAGKKLDEIQAELAKFLQGPMPYAVRTYLVGTGGLLG